MLIEVNVQATSEYVRIELPQFGASTTVKNSVAYRVDKKGTTAIVAVGEDADSLRSKTPAHLHGELAQLHFVHPFAMDQFALGYIEAMIRYYIAVLTADRRRTNWFRSLYIDRLNLHLSIAEYEKLPLEQRQEFEYGLQKSFIPKLRDLSVNSGSLLSPEFIQAQRRFERQCATADWVLWILRAVGMFGPFWFLARVWHSLPITSDPVWIFVWLVAELASVVLGDWLALTLWGIVMPRFLSLSMLRTVATKANIAQIEKAWLGKLLHEPKSISTTS